MIPKRIVFSMVAVVAILQLVACGSDPVSTRFDFIAEGTFSVDEPVTTQTTFRLIGVNGNIVVTASGSAIGVSATGVRKVNSDNQEDADRRLLDLEVRSTSTQDEILIETVQPAETDGRSYVVDYEITVPASLVMALTNLNGNIDARSATQDLFITNTNGDIGVVNSRKSVTVNGTNGNISLQVLRGNATVILVNGNIEADAILAGADTLSMATTNGNVVLEIPADTSAEFFGMSVNGLISLEQITLQDPVQTQETLSGRLGAGEGSIDLRTVNGNVVLAELVIQL